MITETYQFICKYCDKGYRGLVKTCPNCGAVIRKPVTYSEDTKYYATYTLPADVERDLDIEVIYYKG